MAAVICSSVSDLCTGLCNGIGRVICLPCRLCGMATAELCDIIGSPFCLYLSVALGLNLPPVVFAISASRRDGAGQNSCSGVMKWLMVNAVLSAVNMIAALYIVNKIQANKERVISDVESSGQYFQAGSSLPGRRGSGSGITTGTGGVGGTKGADRINQTRENSFSRVHAVLCYDPGVALYIIAGMVYIVWQCMGISRSTGAENYCGDAIHADIANSLICGWLFMFLGATSFFCSIFCLR